MYCKNCGKNLNKGEMFCANCGTKVESENDIVINKQPEETANNNKIIGVIVTLFLFAYIVF